MWNKRKHKIISNKLKSLFESYGTFDYDDIIELAYFLYEPDIEALKLTLRLLDKENKIFIISKNDRNYIDWIDF